MLVETTACQSGSVFLRHSVEREKCGLHYQSYHCPLEIYVGLGLNRNCDIGVHVQLESPGQKGRASCRSAP